MNQTYTKHTLDNGLTILLKEIHTAPVISHWIWYRVGSRCEHPGKTGLSHFVEHMQFKGTAAYDSETIDRIISQKGGHMNAFTYLDWTAYYQTMPADAIRLAVELEADRMTNSLFDPVEVESERTVIISELENQENEPTYRLNEALRKAAFTAHPYRTEIIGQKEDLYNLTRDDLYNHYRNYYAPNNAVLTMAGDFDTDEMLEMIRSAYSAIPAREIPACTAVPEGLINGPLTIEEHGPCDITTMQFIWRCPAGNDPDIFPLTILDSILSGPATLNMFGQGTITNRTSRIYQKLVKSRKAVAIGGGYTTTVDPYMYTLSVFLSPGTDPAEISDTIHEELRDIMQHGITPAELAKACKQARAMFAYSCENITNQAYWLGYSSMFADPEWYTTYTDKLEQVTAEDVRMTAQKYFRSGNCLTGIYSGS